MATRIDNNRNFDESEGLEDLLFANINKFKEYPSDSNFKTFDDLKFYIDNLIQTTENDDLVISLNIISNLIFHKNKAVVASSLGKIYLIIDDEAIRSLMINELSKMMNDHDAYVKKNALRSMEIIACDVNKSEMLNLSNDIIHYLSYNLKTYLQTKFNFNTLINRVTNSKMILSYVDKLYDRFEILSVLDNELNISQVNELDEQKETIDEYGVIPFNELKNLEITDETYLNRLTDLYSLTYREKGHIEHLESYLNDDNYKVREMGIDGLIYALKGLANFKNNKPENNLISKLIKTNNPLNSKSTTASYASK